MDALGGYSLVPPPGRGTSWPAVALRVLQAVGSSAANQTPPPFGVTYDIWCIQPGTLCGASGEIALDFMELKRNTDFTKSEELLHANISVSSWFFSIFGYSVFQWGHPALG